MLTPTSSGAHWPVKCDSSTAAGTLLIIWLSAMETSRPSAAMRDASVPPRKGMRAMFPAKTKKQAKVISSG